MEAFEPNPPDWTLSALHAKEFCCPTCQAISKAATKVWINRRSPVFTEDHRRKWQEFYHCPCGSTWWAWSSDRPPSELANQEREVPPPRGWFNPFEE
ncbi:hypothetical protein K9N68_33050 [Kovacikia minuta CCNUW1]|uniref:hypothetical protein n=1 Tax=Kovacikia minuta TaxID=2931930 RepID=UPI001CCD6CA9|nr:hypothetical protein [Kovacikia minuta]UBF26280.1 hypothetical protein K9N68_33050 [Kovacikia minuta CCNUW1]